MTKPQPGAGSTPAPRQLTQAQRESQATADAMGRALVTLIDGRVAIILPAVPESEQAKWLARVAAAIEGA